MRGDVNTVMTNLEILRQELMEFVDEATDREREAKR